uniref:C2H2-type domain-containing protein n=1 Tax=Hippocampus comes TaxID=109280 RepID=A0A3Q2Y9Y5_HIPCM
MKSAGMVDGSLFTESYCNICNAQLISESQRTAHYEVTTLEAIVHLNPQEDKV